MCLWKRSCACVCVYARARVGKSIHVCSLWLIVLIDLMCGFTVRQMCALVKIAVSHARTVQWKHKSVSLTCCTWAVTSGGCVCVCVCVCTTERDTETKNECVTTLHCSSLFWSSKVINNLLIEIRHVPDYCSSLSIESMARAFRCSWSIALHRNVLILFSVKKHHSASAVVMFNRTAVSENVSWRLCLCRTW